MNYYDKAFMRIIGGAVFMLLMIALAAPWVAKFFSWYYALVS